MNKNDYEPFGDEWVKEIKKFPKAILIEMLKNALQKNIELREKYETDNVR